MKLTYIILLLSCLSASAQTMSTHAYKQRGDKKLELDVYEPATNIQGIKKPVIIFFHGGGLVGGDRQSLSSQCKYYARNGVVAVTASYYLLRKGGGDAATEVEKCIMDAKSAIRWVKQHAADFRIDTNRVFLGGGSAGGFLATEAAFNPAINDPADDLKISTKALGLVLFNPAYIPVRRYGPDVTAFISKKTPPSILFYGEKDANYKPGGDNYFNLLKKQGVPSELWVANGEAHGFYNKPGWSEATVHRSFDFLVENGLLKKAITVNPPEQKTLVAQQAR